LDYILKEEKIKNDIKQIFLKLIDYKEIQQQQQNINEREKENLEKTTSMAISSNFPNKNKKIVSVPSETNNIEDSDDSDNDLKLQETSTAIIQNQAPESKQISKKLIVEIEFFIHQNLSDLIQTTYLNNFINYRSKKTFQELLENFLNNFLQKLKSKNLLESKLALIDQEVTDVYLHFANFFIKIFKDELELDSINNFFNTRELKASVDNDYVNSKKDLNIKKREPKDICNCIIDYFIIKFKNRNDKEISILSEIINKIIDLYPKFIIRIIGYLIRRFNILKIKRSNDIKTFNSIFANNLNSDRIFIEILSKLFKDNNEYIKLRLKLLFDICISEGELEFLNNFIQVGLQYYSSYIENDNEIFMKILSYSSFETINKLAINIQSIPNNINFNVLNLLSNPEKICKIIEISVDMTIFEQEKMWILINSIKNLNKILQIRELIIAVTNYLKYLKTKQEKESHTYNFENFKNSLFKNFMMNLRFHYLQDLNSLNDPNNNNNNSKIQDFILLFEIPYLFSQEIYEVLKMFSIYVNNFPEIFSILLQEFIKKYDNDINKNFYMENFIKILQEFVFIEKYNLFSVLFDSNIFTLKNMLNKIDYLAKVSILLIVNYFFII